MLNAPDRQLQYMFDGLFIHCQLRLSYVGMQRLLAFTCAGGRFDPPCFTSDYPVLKGFLKSKG